MPLQGLYKISAPIDIDKGFTAGISFDPEHEVFAGHFPGQPVVPGVVLIRIVRDLVSRSCGRQVKLQQATNVKFLNIIDPKNTQEVTLSGSMQEDGAGHVTVNAIISSGETKFFRFKGTFS